MPRKVRALQPFVAHGSGVNCLHVGPKSSGVLVTGGADRLVNVWRVGKPTAIMTLAGHNTPITSVRFNNTEESVNAGSQGGTIKVFALSSGGKTVRKKLGKSRLRRSPGQINSPCTAQLSAYCEDLSASMIMNMADGGWHTAIS